MVSELERQPPPLVSVCLPAYQAEGHLEAAVESVLTQSLDDWELVVLDNASTDGTNRVLARYQDPRIRVARNEQTVPMDENWNRVLEMARGRYLKLLPADDLLAPDCLAQQVSDLETHPQASLAVGRRDFVGPTGSVLLRARGLAGLTGELEAGRVVRHVVRSGRNPIGEMASMLFRREAFEAVGPFDGSLVFPMDLDYALRLLNHGTMVGRGDVVAAFRVRSDSQTATSFASQGFEHRAWIRRVVEDEATAASRFDMIVGFARSWSAVAQRRLLFGTAARIASYRPGGSAKALEPGTQTSSV